MRTLLIDNYDSFVYNLYQLVGELNGNPIVFRNDEITLAEAEKLNPDRIIISPGPGHPANPRSFGNCTPIIREMGRQIPILGVCLGHQGIVHVYGGKISRAPLLVHGKTSQIQHDGRSLYKGLPNPIVATRYHSLAAPADGLPEALQVTASSVGDGVVMGVRHREYPVEGIQFHPESILTRYGKRILRNFLREGVAV